MLEQGERDFEKAKRRSTYSAVKVCLVAAPEIPEKIAHEMASELPRLLGKQVDERVFWKVSVVVDPLTGADRKAPDISTYAVIGDWKRGGISQSA